MNALLEGLEKQGGDDGDRDRGDRSSVTGSKHLDGFRELVALLFEEVGLKRPWLGYSILSEDAAGSNNPVKVKEPHFRVFPEFRDASYAERYNQLLTKLMRKRLYDACCFLMSSSEGGLKGEYREPSQELGFHTFVTSLLARAIAVARTQPPEPATPPTIETGPSDLD